MFPINAARVLSFLSIRCLVQARQNCGPKRWQISCTPRRFELWLCLVKTTQRHLSSKNFSWKITRRDQPRSKCYNKIIAISFEFTLLVIQSLVWVTRRSQAKRFRVPYRARDAGLLCWNGFFCVLSATSLLASNQRPETSGHWPLIRRNNANSFS